MMQQPNSVYFEQQVDEIYRSSSLVPDTEFEVFARKEGFESERERMTMKEGTNDSTTIELRPDKKDTDIASDDVSGKLEVK